MRASIERDHVPTLTPGRPHAKHQAQLRRRSLRPARQHRVAHDESVWLLSLFNKAYVAHSHPPVPISALASLGKIRL